MILPQHALRLKLLCSHCSLAIFDLIRTKIVKELFVVLVCAQIFKLLVDHACKCSTLVIDGPEQHSFFGTLLLKSFKLSGCFACLLFDGREECEEVLCVFLKHLLGADKTELAHLIEIG